MLWQFQRRILDENTGDNQGGGTNRPNYVNPWQAPSYNAGQQQGGNQAGAGGAQNGNQSQQSSNQPGGGTANPGPGAAPGDALQQHIRSLGLMDGIDFGSIATDLQNGDPASLQAAFEGAVTKVFTQSLMHTNQIVDRRADQLQKQATDQATSKVQADQALAQLQAAMPFTKEPEVLPLAQATLASMMKQGQSVEQAVANAQRYLGELGARVTTHFKAAEVPEGIVGSEAFNAGTGGGAGDNNYNGEPSETSGLADGSEWMDLLGAPEPQKVE